MYGDSIGHWEGNVLVVDTTMFLPDRGILSIPGGGFRTADSHLVERFQLLKNGQVLQLVSTWTDANVFKGPHTYEYRYNRMPRDYDGRARLRMRPLRRRARRVPRESETVTAERAQRGSMRCALSIESSVVSDQSQSIGPPVRDKSD